MAVTSLSDRVIFAVVQCLAVLRHPRITQSFWKRRGRIPNFARPSELGETVQWRKVFDHNPLFNTLCDKLAAKRWVAERFPDVTMLEPVWVGTKPEDVPEALTRPGYIIKANHGCRANYFPHLKPLPRPALNRLMARWLRRSYYLQGQWGYRGIPRKLFVERRIGVDAPLTEYCFRCHDGVVAVCYIVRNQHQDGECGCDFAGDGTRLPPMDGKDPANNLPPDYVLPPSYFRARDMASRISRGLDHVRVDFLVDGDRVYLGELTIYPGSGYGTERLSHTDHAIELAWFRALHLSWFSRTTQPWPLSIYQRAFRRWVGTHVQDLDAAAPADERGYSAPASA
jgi:hypothetical protein